MFQKLLKKLSSAFVKYKIPYMVIGGQAVLVYGEPRLTKDIDITLGIDTDKIDLIKKIVKKLKLRTLVTDIDSFAGKTMVYPAIDAVSGIKIDFIFSNSFYESQAIKKANKIKIDKTFIAFASLEDVVIHKVIAKRERDKEDVKNILIKNKNYNITYIREWLGKFDESLNDDFLKVFEDIVKNLRY